MTPRARMRYALAGAVVALTFALTWSLAKVPTLEDQVSRSAQETSNLSHSVDTLRGQVDANAQALADANAKLIALGKAPVPVPAPSAPVQVDGFTEAEAAAVRLIVSDMIARTPARITQAEISQIARVAAALVPKPKDGKTPTAAELQPAVTAALAAYCVDDKCVGKTGDTGKQGEPGANAPAVTDEQLLAAARQALVAYCGQDSKPCQGPAGSAGPPPYSVVDQDCVGDGNASVWKTYLSNGSDQKVITSDGPCRIGPDPN